MIDDKVALQDVVANFLRRNPGFLNDYPDVLELLQLRHHTGVATSLIERQVAQLRQKNEELNRQLNRLVHVASENEQLMSRLHELTLELMAIRDPADFFSHLGCSLLDDFNADILRICLFDREMVSLAGGDVRWVDADDEHVQQFRSQLEKNHTVCGRLGEGKLAFLFENRAQWVQSTALVPIGTNGYHGLMAIGSSDPARFYPGMGTLFLDLLADVIASNLANNDRPAAQRRSA